MRTSAPPDFLNSLGVRVGGDDAHDDSPRRPNWGTLSSAADPSQIALPKASCDEVYASAGYEQSVRNLSQVSLASDMVFSDGAALELATVMGSVSGGYTSALTVAV